MRPPPRTRRAIRRVASQNLSSRGNPKYAAKARASDIVTFRNPNFAPIVESAGPPMAGLREQRWLRPLFQIGAHDADQIIRSFFGRFAVSRHMVANVVFHEFGHEAVDRWRFTNSPN